MGNAFFCVFQACRFLASVFSRAHSFSLCKFVWRQIPQTAVRAAFVVLRLPRRDLAPGIEQILKPTYVQTLFPHARMKTFHPSVLRRLARLYVHQLDLPLHAPGQKMPAGELRPVVAADRTGLAPLRYDRLQHTRHSPAGKTRIHFQSQTLPRIRTALAAHLAGRSAEALNAVEDRLEMFDRFATTEDESSRWRR